jgi:hypothetical protein
MALSYFDEARIVAGTVALSEKSASQGPTVLHPRLAQYALIGPVKVEFEDTFAAIVALSVFP